MVLRMLGARPVLDRDGFTVTTPDNVDLGFPTAGLGTRMAAAIVDHLVLGIVYFVAIILVSVIASDWFPGLAGESALLVMVGFSSLVLLGYFALSEAMTGGRTLGKMACGLRVVRSDGGAIGFSEAIVRNAARLVDYIGIGPVLMFFHPQSRRIGDLMAGTVVVRERSAVSKMAWATPSALPVFLRSTDPGPTITGVDRLGGRELGALRTFLSRLDLHPVQKNRVAGQLAVRLCDLLGLPPDASERSEPPENFLERLFLQLDHRQGT